MASEQMLVVGLFSIIALVGLIPLYETGNERYVKYYLIAWIMWEILWLGPPLFQVWINGVLG